MVRVTAKQVTISNEAGERQEDSTWMDIFILKKIQCHMDQVTDAMVLPYLGLGLLPKCWYLTAYNLTLALGVATCTQGYNCSAGPELGTGSHVEVSLLLPLIPTVPALSCLG